MDMNLTYIISVISVLFALVRLLIEVEYQIRWLSAKLRILRSCSCCFRRAARTRTKWEDNFMRSIWRKNPEDLSLPQIFKILEIHSARIGKYPVYSLVNRYIANLRNAISGDIDPLRARVDTMPDSELHQLFDRVM